MAVHGDMQIRIADMPEIRRVAGQRDRAPRGSVDKRPISPIGRLTSKLIASRLHRKLRRAFANRPKRPRVGQRLRDHRVAERVRVERFGQRGGETFAVVVGSKLACSISA